MLERVGHLIHSDFEYDDIADAIWYGRNDLPWNRWAEHSERVRRVLAETQRESRPRGKPSTPIDLTAPLSELLELTRRGAYPRALLHRLRTQLPDSDVALLRRRTLDPEAPGWNLALRALELHRDPSALETVAEVFQRNDGGGRRAAAWRYLRALDTSVALPLARRWIDADDVESTSPGTSLASTPGRSGPDPKTQSDLGF